eukprot:TRINITY_DN5850_c0_g1_i1.p1 TRINITY_DN5850_c0_g1~~TRINITY_DN5850_c0_g1_i1.p1  ORF type:complete len:291 (-),score=56.73 TRINITY_DN5850_c0_g1_i1:276-1148(-)
MAEEGEKVFLNVYDLSQGLARQLSTTFLGKAIEGIWHTGIVVYGKEYYFGGGIQNSPQGQTPYGRPWKVVELGVTHIPKEVLEDFLQEISPRYTTETYSLLSHNCNNFSNEVAQFLVGCGIPDFILRLPEEVMNSPMGALLMPMINQFESILRHGGVPQVPQPVAPSSTTISLQQQKPPEPGTRKALEPAASTTKRIELNTCSEIPLAANKPCLDGSNSSGDKAPPAAKEDSTSADPLGEARSRVQEEISREFASLMANGTLRASEAAAIATRRVMEKHGTLRTTTSSQG